MFWRSSAVESSAPERLGVDEVQLAQKVADAAATRIERAQDEAGRSRMVKEMDAVLASTSRWVAPEAPDPELVFGITDFSRRDALQAALEAAGAAQAAACTDLKTLLLTEGTDFRGSDFTRTCFRVQETTERLLIAMNASGEERADRRVAGLRGQLQSTPLADPEGDLAWVQAERLAAAALRKFGFDDALPTGSGTDAGLDVAGRFIACQVKYTVRPVGRPVLQQLVGAAGGRVTAFFSQAGYTAQAIEYADQVGMALFGLTLPTTVSPQNSAAREMAG